jgi:predicted metal-dependent hydrolase
MLDWDRRFDPLWHDSNPAVTHAFNALSLLIPWGESHIVEVAGNTIAMIDLSAHADLKQQVKNLIAQEAIHSRQHNHYNELLRARGHVGDFGRMQRLHKEAMRRLHQLTHRRFSHLTRLAFICAFEHYTAVTGDYVLDHASTLAHMPEQLRLVWGWHAAEEIEHKEVCFDLYLACGGGRFRRIAVFTLASMELASLFCLIYFRLMRQGGAWRAGRRVSSVGSIFQALFSSSGIVRHLLRHFFHYLRPSFHPRDLGNREKARAWLYTHQDHLRACKPRPVSEWLSGLPQSVADAKAGCPPSREQTARDA